MLCSIKVNFTGEIESTAPSDIPDEVALDDIENVWRDFKERCYQNDESEFILKALDTVVFGDITRSNQFE